MYRHILIPTDGTEIADKAVAEGARSGTRHPGEGGGPRQGREHQLHDRIRAERPPLGPIIETARRHGCDAIFMATHARTGFAALVHGSETHDVLVNSDIPTFVYR
jgi:nucleotide-binding universal stress UspA family protein